MLLLVSEVLRQLIQEPNNAAFIVKKKEVKHILLHT